MNEDNFSKEQIKNSDDKKMIAVMCRCSKTKKLFGIRFDHITGDIWEYAWAFPLKEGADKREKLYRLSVKGRFVNGKNYNGCPYCGNKNFYQCGNCKNLVCWDGIIKPVTCPHCGNKGNLTRKNISEINADDNL